MLCLQRETIRLIERKLRPLRLVRKPVAESTRLGVIDYRLALGAINSNLGLGNGRDPTAIERSGNAIRAGDKDRRAVFDLNRQGCGHTSTDVGHFTAYQRPEN